MCPAVTPALSSESHVPDLRDRVSLKAGLRGSIGFGCAFGGLCVGQSQSARSCQVEAGLLSWRMSSATYLLGDDEQVRWPHTFRAILLLKIPS